MAKSSSVISPILADLSQDIAGAIPLELILLWSTSARNAKKHAELLSQHSKRGVVVSSDASGLSKLSAQKSLLEVMHLVGQPKEVIYSYGKGVGGEAIGIWAADNTQMFYGENVKPDDVIEAMVHAQHEIKKDLLVQVGMGVHLGDFIEIGGGLYGNDAHHVEELAESHTEAGEISITLSLKKRLGKQARYLFQKHPTYPNAFKVDYSDPSNRLVKHTQTKYPEPFDHRFSDLIHSIEQLSPDEVEHQYRAFAKDTVVILIKISHRKRSLLLNQLTDYIVANAYIKQVSKEFKDISLVKSNGDLGIFVTQSDPTAIEFARKVYEKLRGNGFDVNVGLCRGEVLLFPMQEGYEIAGGPVNVASKIAEDGGELNRIFVEESVSMPKGSFDAFIFTISKVEIRGKYLV